MILKPNLENWSTDPLTIHTRYIARLGKKYRDLEDKVSSIKRSFPIFWIFLPSFWITREEMKDAKWWYESEVRSFREFHNFKPYNLK
jgi:hypothetical protein